ncbi:uncharacterized protein LOC112544184 [Pelodiscus sinensis]|uniref:uncharacterized protein LOC112544184 n=1 Tax=Pelodiscus sinensis TaxID=13735 RepID=UPI000D71F90E|nr:uncharacterized protein LOC112544184 [Pelodiscus sinensis]|eukprot:XP_025035700.1 uncharacterized protein LOC112544184 [Pelodiscus sinensis]
MEGPSLVSRPCYLEPLTVENLLRMRCKLESEGQMTRERKARFNGVLRTVKESELVQSNARTVIECDGGDLEYLCSDGGETVFVLCQGGEPLYIGKKRDSDSYPSPPLPEAERLSIRHLLGAMSRLETQHRMTEELRTCFECALENFRKEPNFVQENARLVISCEGKERHFASGNGENEFVVYLQDGKPRYESQVLGWGAYLFKMLARLF